MHRFSVYPTSAPKEADLESALCTWCQHLSFSRIFSGPRFCFRHMMKDKETDPSAVVQVSDSTVSIGSVRRVQESTACPVYRLVTSCIISTDFTIDPSLQVVLRYTQHYGSHPPTQLWMDTSNGNSVGTVDPNQETKSNPCGVNAQMEENGQESDPSITWITVQLNSPNGDYHV